MTDIVERLRYQSKDFGYLRLEAAAEIERLRDEIEQLRTEIARMQTGR